MVLWRPGLRRKAGGDRWGRRAAAVCIRRSRCGAAVRSGVWSDLFGQSRPRPRRAALPAVPLPKPRPADAPATKPDQPEAAKQPLPGAVQPDAEQQAAPVPAAPSACRLALTEAIAIAPSIPTSMAPAAAGGEDLVRLEAVVLPDQRQVSVKPAAILRCAMASALADWVRTDIAPLASGLGSVISGLDNFDSFECRGRNRVVGAQLSEHGRANALDVRALKLADGRSISLTDRNVPRELRENVLHSVCARFTTVLGPGSDGYHEDHIHLDLMQRHNNYKICQWDVWDPLPPVAPLLPAERRTKRRRASPPPQRTMRRRRSLQWHPQQKSAGKPALFISSNCDYCITIIASCRWGRLAAPSANCTASRHDAARAQRQRCPSSTRLYRSITSSFVIRMQPEEIDAPIYSGWLVP